MKKIDYNQEPRGYKIPQTLSPSQLNSASQSSMSDGTQTPGGNQ